MYLKWALPEYSRIASAEDLITTAFNKGIKPVMHDEIIKQEKKSQVHRPVRNEKSRTCVWHRLLNSLGWYVRFQIVDS